MFWKHIEQGYPSARWIIYTVAGTAAGSWAGLWPSLQQQAYMHTTKHSKGSSAMNIRHKNIWICTMNSDTRNSDITMISAVSILGTVASTTMPYTNNANEIPLPMLIVHLLRGSRDSAKDLIMFPRGPSSELRIVGTAYSAVIAFWALYIVVQTE